MVEEDKKEKGEDWKREGEGGGAADEESEALKSA